MFNARKKIVKDKGAAPDELEEEVAKSLQHFEQQAEARWQQHLKLVFVNSCEHKHFKNSQGAEEQYIMIRIPFRSLLAYRKVANKVIEHLEQKFKKTVVIVANRTIISPHAVMHPTQKRPRSRTLKAVHKAILDDIVQPSSVTGRQVRVTVEGRHIEKIFMDPMDRDAMEHRLDALSDAYKSLTTHSVHFEFSKPTAFQISKLEKKKEAARRQ